VINIVLDARNGLPPSEIQRQYPHLSLAQIHAALAYYYDHQGEIDDTIERELREVAAIHSDTATPSRDELLSRTEHHSWTLH